MTNQGKLLLMTLMTTRTQKFSARTVYRIQNKGCEVINITLFGASSIVVGITSSLFHTYRSLPHRKSDENYDYQNGPGSLPLLMNKLKVDKIKTPSKIRPREPLRTSTKV